MNPSPDALVLIGFMGAGKTSVGTLLAARTGFPLFDTDAMILSKHQTPIVKIIERLGLEGFRDEETSVLSSIPPGPAIVVTGGGAVLRPENVEVMKELGALIWLRASRQTISDRITDPEDRPLLHGVDLGQRITELLRIREPLYLAAADVTVETDALAPDAIADLILKRWPKMAGVSGS